MTASPSLPAAILLLLLAPTATLAQSIDARLDQAKAQRYSNQTAQANQTVEQVLAQDPGNFRANYTKGLIQNDLNDRAGAIRTLTGTIQRLNGAPAPDPAIYNTLGWMLMVDGDYKAAERWYLTGYAQRERLPAESRRKLLNNLGALYSLRGDRTSATRYFNEAAKAGSPAARGNLKRLVD
jgi:Flp pilus assembly protein TadD